MKQVVMLTYGLICIEWCEAEEKTFVIYNYWSYTTLGKVIGSYEISVAQPTHHNGLCLMQYSVTPGNNGCDVV